MGMVGFSWDSVPILVGVGGRRKAQPFIGELVEEKMKNGTEEWRKGGVALPLGTDVLSRPREVDEFYFG